jgi:hypothetical protein
MGRRGAFTLSHHLGTACCVLLTKLRWEQALILAISSIVRVVQVAQVCFAFILGFFFIFTGFLINTNSIPWYYGWAKYSSFIKVRTLVASNPSFLQLMSADVTLLDMSVCFFEGAHAVRL